MQRHHVCAVLLVLLLAGLAQESFARPHIPVRLKTSSGWAKKDSSKGSKDKGPCEKLAWALKPVVQSLAVKLRDEVAKNSAKIADSRAPARTSLASLKSQLHKAALQELGARFSAQAAACKGKTGVVILRLINKAEKEVFRAAKSQSKGSLR
eukprot:jgi/Chlat1/6323/Chrsp44S05795